MSRRLAKLALALSLLTSSISPALAGFARPPSAGAPARMTELRVDESEMYVPVISDQARARLRVVLAKRRAKNLRSFAAYVARGSYPHNYVTPDKLNVWIDEDGHMCAAATMIFRSTASARSLVRQVAKDDNYIRLADVTDGPLLDWILTSGLTHDEVVAIQEPFDGPDEPPAKAPVDWKTAEDNRLRARYATVMQQLRGDRDASLEAAIDALAFRPDLVARLIGLT
jgi:hypothetical protein